MGLWFLMVFDSFWWFSMVFNIYWLGFIIYQHIYSYKWLKNTGQRCQGSDMEMCLRWCGKEVAVGQWEWRCKGGTARQGRILTIYTRSNIWEMRNRVGAGKGMSLEMGQSLCEGTRSRCHSLTMFIAHALNYVCGGCLVPCWLHRMEVIPLSMGHVRLVLRMSNLSNLSKSTPPHSLITSCSVLWVQYDR